MQEGGDLFSRGASDKVATLTYQPSGPNLVTFGTESLASNFSNFSPMSVMPTTEEQAPQAQPESPTSRFTAVNGKDLGGGTGPTSNPTGTGPGPGNELSRRNSDERSNGQPRITPPGQEKLTITTTTTSRDDWNPPANGDRQPYQGPNSYGDADASHKRKRSGSIEQTSSSANSYHNHALPPSTKQTPTTATTESDGPRDESLQGPSPSDQREVYSAETPYRSFLGSPEDHRDIASGHDSWHGRQYSNQSQLTSDEHLREVLQSASQMDSQHDYASPGDDEKFSSPYGGYGNDRREMSAQSDPKKRKRNFSNRTKTGCMTCRRRKKKCDENKPECKFKIFKAFPLLHGCSY